jgi:L-asparaginase
VNVSISVVSLGGTVNSFMNHAEALSVDGPLGELQRTQVATTLLDSLGEEDCEVFAPVWGMSEEFTDAEWFMVAGWLRQHIAERHPDGVILLHGTDTLEWTAAALSFLLAPPVVPEFLSVPVVLTGALVPAGLPGSDAGANLAGALTAARTLPPGVYVSFCGSAVGESQVHVGARVTKSSLEAPAFTSVSVPPVGVADMFGAITVDTKWVRHLGDRFPVDHPFDVLAHVGDNLAAAPRLREFTPAALLGDPAGKVAVVDVTPMTDWGMLTGQVENYAAHGTGGVVLRLYLSGTAPSNNEASAVTFVRECVAHHIPVVGVLPSPQWRTPPEYESSRLLVGAGLRTYQTMTLPAAVTKLAAALYVATQMEPEPSAERYALTHAVMSIPFNHEFSMSL